MLPKLHAFIKAFALTMVIAIFPMTALTFEHQIAQERQAVFGLKLSALEEVETLYEESALDESSSVASDEGDQLVPAAPSPRVVEGSLAVAPGPTVRRVPTMLVKFTLKNEEQTSTEPTEGSIAVVASDSDEAITDIYEVPALEPGETVVIQRSIKTSLAAATEVSVEVGEAAATLPVTRDLAIVESEPTVTGVRANGLVTASRVKVSYTIKNLGTAPTADFASLATIELTNGKVFKKLVAVKGLGAGDYRVVSHVFATGRIFIKSVNVIVDPNKTIFEDDTNNRVSKSFGDSSSNSTEQIVLLPNTTPADQTVGPFMGALTAGIDHSCVIKPDRTVWCWGGTKQLFKEIEVENTSTFKKEKKVVYEGDKILSIPEQVLDKNGQPFKDAAALSAGDDFTCTLKLDGTVWCWNNDGGSAWVGALGNGKDDRRQFTAVQVIDTNKVALSKVKDITTGGDHGCALKTDGSVWCWGYNADGQLGNNTNTNSNVAVSVVGKHIFTDVNAALSSTCAIDAAALVWCWGGEIQTASLAPLAILDNQNMAVQGVKKLAHGQLSDGFVAFQKNQDDSLWGIGKTPPGKNAGGPNQIPFNVPRQIVDMNNQPVLARQSSAGGGFTNAYGHGCILNKDDSGASCWGVNDYGQLGDGTKDSRQFPVVVQNPQGGALKNLYQIEASGVFTCAIRTEAKFEVWCWGYNYQGTLGDGTTNDSKLPVQVKLP